MLNNFQQTDKEIYNGPVYIHGHFNCPVCCKEKTTLVKCMPNNSGENEENRIFVCLNCGSNYKILESIHREKKCYILRFELKQKGNVKKGKRKIFLKNSLRIITGLLILIGICSLMLIISSLVKNKIIINFGLFFIIGIVILFVILERESIKDYNDL